METRYEVVCQGRLVPGFTRQQAIDGLMAVFGLAQDRAAALAMSAGATVVKATADYGIAQRTADRLRRAGLAADIRVRPDTAEPVPASHGPAVQSPQHPASESSPRPCDTGPRPAAAAIQNSLANPMVTSKPADPCPACGALRVEQGICGACGIAAEKFLARQQAERAAARAASSPPVRLPLPPAGAAERPRGRPVRHDPPAGGGALRALRGLLWGVLGFIMISVLAVTCSGPLRQTEQADSAGRDVLRAQRGQIAWMRSLPGGCGPASRCSPASSESSSARP